MKRSDVLLLLGGAALLMGAFASDAIRGIVTDGANVLAGAIVRVRATDIQDVTDAQGQFTLEGITSDDSVEVTVAKPGFFNLLKKAKAGDSTLAFSLTRIPETDHPDYAWTNPAPDSAQEGNCANCHLRIYTEWNSNFHAKSARDPFVLNMYNGTDAEGNQNVGPGYKLDFPNNVGACANCHAPLATVDAPSTVDLNEVVGVDTLGVTCDFCHKIESARVNTTGAFYGVISIDVKRPPAGTKLLFGPFDDAMLPTGELEFSYSPLFRSSLFCAPCHDGSFWGVPAYNTFQEYRASPYPALGIECQDCHMTSNQRATRFTNPDCLGGRDRGPLLLSTHTQPGAHSDSLLKTAATLSLSATVVGDSVVATVVIENTNAGHHLPTGHAMRNLILLVTATDAEGDTLPFVRGETVPGWGGEGSWHVANYAGLPGKGYAKVLEDFNERSPSPSWRQTRILQDNRIPAMARDTSFYVFRKSSGTNTFTVRAQLIYRLFFKPIIDVKKWNLQDVVMAEDHFTFTRTAVEDDTNVLPGQPFALHQNYPNPFREQTTIGFSLERSARVRMEIFNALGQLVRTLVDEERRPGHYSVAWDGTLSNGQTAASGVYIYQVQFDQVTLQRMATFVK